MRFNEDTRVKLPPKVLAHRYTQEVKRVFELIETLEEHNEELKKLRDWLLPMLINGQLLVND